MYGSSPLSLRRSLSGKQIERTRYLFEMLALNLEVLISLNFKDYHINYCADRRILFHNYEKQPHYHIGILETIRLWFALETVILQFERSIAIL